MKTLKPLVTHCAEETIRAAKAFAKNLRPGDVIALEGDLGSGKTTFIKGIAAGLGFSDSDEVKSPTFALMHVYPAKIPLYHFDLYRLEKAQELEAIGFDEFVNDLSAVTCIEWADKARGLLPAAAYHVRIEISKDPGSRLISYQRRQS